MKIDISSGNTMLLADLCVGGRGDAVETLRRLHRLGYSVAAVETQCDAGQAPVWNPIDYASETAQFNRPAVLALQNPHVFGLTHELTVLKRLTIDMGQPGGSTQRCAMNRISDACVQRFDIVAMRARSEEQVRIAASAPIDVISLDCSPELRLPNTLANDVHCAGITFEIQYGDQQGREVTSYQLSRALRGKGFLVSSGSADTQLGPLDHAETCRDLFGIAPLDAGAATHRVLSFAAARRLRAGV